MTAAPDTPAPPPPGRTPPWALHAYAVGVLAGTVAGWGGRWHWLLDLASHFRSIWLVLAVAGLVACLRWRSRLAAACLAVAAAGNAAEMLPYWLPARAVVDAAATTGQRVTVIVANVHRLNDDATAAVAYLHDRRPDVAAVLEVDPAWADALEGLADVFPHRVVRPRSDNFGIALLSRWPLDDVAVVDFGVPDRPSIVATVRGESAPFRFIATHPSPPFNGRATTVLEAHLAAVAAAAAAAPLPCIVAGDFNATPWSHPFRTLVATSGLRDTALGRGVQATWNARYPVPRIPIDHILAPRNATVVSRVVGPDIGSDHFPVEAELILPAAE
jgi:endonuclease/exonuclease/phosphatase (EEP) superfamily protein YafD